ncbi:hypothetical protein M8C21_014503 [Ambrosia artemisiifolia]|uniref:Uncharacterized protein n=1 Tax=Ambrosia artemisiifolia TaxID=4212 RepID=A0AAD5DBR3_AMBAR|nr:hypothetical protein M8C21_014503 [Ambrosia artemisiifolia]
MGFQNKDQRGWYMIKLEIRLGITGLQPGYSGDWFGKEDG